MLLRFCRGVRTQGLRTTISWSLRRTKNQWKLRWLLIPTVLRSSCRDLGRAWRLRPIAGGAPDDDSDDDDDSDEGDDSGPDDDDSDEDSEDDQDDDSDEDDDQDDDDDDEPLTKKERNELNRLKREESERRKKDKAEKKRRAEESGKWKEHAEESEKRADKAEEDAETAKTELARFKREINVSKIARKLKFNDPDDALAFLSEDAADGDEKQVEKALKKVLKEKPYLKGSGGSRRTRGGGGGEDDDDSSEPDLDNMTPAEIREWESKL
jgi:hypothetical protein